MNPRTPLLMATTIALLMTPVQTASATESGPMPAPSDSCAVTVQHIGLAACGTADTAAVALAGGCRVSVGNCTGGYCTLNLAGVCSEWCGINVVAVCEGACFIVVASVCADQDACLARVAGVCPTELAPLSFAVWASCVQAGPLCVVDVGGRHYSCIVTIGETPDEIQMLCWD